MEPLVEKLVANKKLHEVCLTTKWLSAGFPISGDSYKIEAHVGTVVIPECY
jgi:hypothetical protein